MSCPAHCNQLASPVDTRPPDLPAHPDTRAVSLVPEAPCLCLVTNHPISIIDVVYNITISAKNLVVSCAGFICSSIFTNKKLSFLTLIAFIFNFLKGWWLLFKLLETFAHLEWLLFFKSYTTPDSLLHSVVNPKDELSFPSWGRAG